MTDKQFIEQALRTESSNFNLTSPYSHERLIHAAFGMQTESAEFTDALKKSLFYGKQLDTVNLKEELGDLLWYVAIAMDELDTDFSTEFTRVIGKLQARYPDKYSNINAESRDLDKERSVLESI